MQGLMVLRKAIVGRMDARLRAAPETSDAVVLDHAGSAFIGAAADVVPRLRAVFTAEQASLHLLPKDGPREPQCGNAGAVIAAINDFTPTPAQRKALRAFAARLPSVAVKLAPLHRMGLREFAPYVDLHRRMLRDGEVTLADWLALAADEHDLDRRLRTFALCFCLGLIAPAKKQDAQQGRADGGGKSGRASVLARIIQRVRGL